MTQGSEREWENGRLDGADGMADDTVSVGTVRSDQLYDYYSDDEQEQEAHVDI